jgi:hypothetical protein
VMTRLPFGRGHRRRGARLRAFAGRFLAEAVLSKRCDSTTGARRYLTPWRRMKSRTWGAQRSTCPASWTN